MAKKDSEKEKKEKPEKAAKEKPVKDTGKGKVDKKAKKGKKGKKGEDAADAGKISPESMANPELEQALRDSADPTSQLKRLRSPVNVKSILLLILLFIVLTFAIVLIWCAVAVDKFNFVTVFSDMFEKFGITQFFQNIWNTMSGWFK